MRDAPPLLVTGATGYVGGRLVGRLLEAGHRVRVLVRNPARLQGCAWLVQTAIFAPKGGWGCCNGTLISSTRCSSLASSGT